MKWYPIPSIRWSVAPRTYTVAIKLILLHVPYYCTLQFMTQYVNVCMYVCMYVCMRVECIWKYCMSTYPLEARITECVTREIVFFVCMYFCMYVCMYVVYVYMYGKIFNHLLRSPRLEVLWTSSPLKWGRFWGWYPRWPAAHTGGSPGMRGRPGNRCYSSWCRRSLDTSARMVGEPD